MLFPFAQDASRHIKHGTHIGGYIPCRCRLPKHSANHLAPSLCAGTQENKRRSSPPIEMQDLGHSPCRMMGWNSLRTVQSRSVELGIFLLRSLSPSRGLSIAAHRHRKGVLYAFASPGTEAEMYKYALPLYRTGHLLVRNRSDLV